MVTSCNIMIKLRLRICLRCDIVIKHLFESFQKNQKIRWQKQKRPYLRDRSFSILPRTFTSRLCCCTIYHMKQVTITVHLILVILAYTAWIWLDYRIVIVGALLHLIMLETLNGCPLSLAQFKNHKQKDTRFYEWWMGKLGVNLSGSRLHKMRIFMQYILPLLIIILAVIFQVAIDLEPLVKL